MRASFGKTALYTGRPVPTWYLCDHGILSNQALGVGKSRKVVILQVKLERLDKRALCAFSSAEHLPPEFFWCDVSDLEEIEP